MKLANIQLLRAVAALVVVLYHLQPMLRPGLHIKTHFGANGVDIFFVISGFVMFYANHDMRARFVPFMAARLLRIVPLYWLATILMVAIFLAGFNPNGLHIFNLEIFVKSLFFIQSKFEGERTDLILSLGWTLIYELYFYLIFSLSFALKDFRKALVAVSVYFVATVIIGELWLQKPYAIAYFTSPIVLEFLYGAWLAYAFITLPALSEKGLTGLGSVSIVAGALGLLFWDLSGLKAPADHAEIRFLASGLPALFIVMGALLLERAGRSARRPLLLLIGAASYALYLFHPIFLQTTAKIGQALLPHSPISTMFSGIAAIAVSLVAAIIIHLFVETPILRAGRTWLRKSRIDRPIETAPIAPDYQVAER